MQLIHAYHDRDLDRRKKDSGCVVKWAEAPRRIRNRTNVTNPSHVAAAVAKANVAKVRALAGITPTSIAYWIPLLAPNGLEMSRPASAWIVHRKR